MIDNNKNYTLCLVCNKKNGNYFLPISEFKIFKCSNCGLEYTNPIPTDLDLKNFYHGYNDIRASKNVVIENAKRNLLALKSYGYNHDKTLLDFGTGEGNFVEIAGDNCFGVDFKFNNKPRCYNQIHDCPVKEFDFITLFGVLEHLSNPLDTLKYVTRFLKKNGIIVITTINAEGVIPYYYKPIEHLTYWTHNSIDILFKKIGLEILEYNPYIMIQNSEVYIERLISRTPEKYRESFRIAINTLPEYIEIPTNEVFIVGRKK